MFRKILKIIFVLSTLFAFSGCKKKQLYHRDLSEEEKELVGVYYTFAIGTTDNYVGISIDTAIKQGNTRLELRDNGAGILETNGAGAIFTWKLKEDNKKLEIDFVKKTNGNRNIADAQIYRDGVIKLVLTDNTNYTTSFFGKKDADYAIVLKEIGATWSEDPELQEQLLSDAEKEEAKNHLNDENFLNGLRDDDNNSTSNKEEINVDEISDENQKIKEMIDSMKPGEEHTIKDENGIPKWIIRKTENGRVEILEVTGKKED